MAKELGIIKALYRYPVKSMAGEQIERAQLGLHGIEGDRRYAFARQGDLGGFPWLTASKYPKMILYKPMRAAMPANIIVRSPEGADYDLDGEPLRKHLSEAHGTEVSLMHLSTGIFDDAHIAMISVSTMGKICAEAGVARSTRRFRPNIVIALHEDKPFQEDAWVGTRVSFGDDAGPPSIGVTRRDKRCVMINLDPDSADAHAGVLKTTARLNDACAGVYASVLHTGILSVGQTVYLL